MVHAARRWRRVAARDPRSLGGRNAPQCRIRVRLRTRHVGRYSTWSARLATSLQAPCPSCSKLLERLERRRPPFAAHVFADNPGVAPMLLPVARRLTVCAAASVQLTTGVIHSQALRLPASTVPVRPLEGGRIPARRDVLRTGACSLLNARHSALEDLELERLNERYRAHRLTRRRTVLAAFDDGRVVGLCIVNRGPFGMNLSLLEHAIEYLRIAPDKVGEARRNVWSALLRAAAAEVSERAASRW